jgi:poly-gamma-glutamate synthesis protein (capsule biosynthesis protein)
LETPASFIGTPYPGKHPNITFRAQPGSLFSLKHAGFNMISLANNHMTDHGATALEETLDALKLLDLHYVGAGNNREQAYAPAIIEKKGWKVAFLAYADPIWSVVEAGTDPGVAHLREDEILGALNKLREDRSADIIIVSLHWGEEYSHRPFPAQRSLAKRIIEAGADAIIGHHPHVMQGVEWHQGKPILYSLGNFAFDQIDDPTYQSVLARLEFSREGKINLTMRPMRIARRSLHQTIPQDEDLAMITRNISYYNSQLDSISTELEGGWIQVCSPTNPATPPDSRSDKSSMP